MFFAKSLISFIIVVISISASAKPVNNFFKNSDGDNYLVTYEEEGIWVLDHILVRPGKLQEKLSSKTFKTKALLDSFQKNKFNLSSHNKLKPNKSKYVSTESPSKVWEVKNQWNLSWEREFSLWLEREFNKDFFKKYNLETDCADVAFALRWIFARNNHLPAANTLAGSHIIFSQDSFKAEWKKLKRDKLWHKDEVFMAAVRYIMLHAYTGTLNIDGYPIKINKDSFLVGTIHLNGGHTMIISSVDYSGISNAPIMKLSSTVPSEVRQLYEEIMIDGQAVDKENGGLFRMRWPIHVNGKWDLIAKADMPLYSLEQYSQEFLGDDNHFTIAIINKLGINFQPKKIVAEAAKSVVSSIEQRIKIVEDGFNACVNLNCSEGTFEYEEYSTPTRDGRIADSFIKVDKLLKQLVSFDETLEDFWNDYKEKTQLSILNRSNSLKHYEFLFKNKLVSYDPEQSIAHRWGVNPQIISETLISRFNNLVRKRQKIVKSAASCIGDKTCRRGSAKWKKHNSYEFDLKLNTGVYNSYVKLCSKYDCSSLFALSFIQNIKSIPFYVSEPTESDRWGRLIENYEYLQLPTGKSIVQADATNFIIDNKIYNISKEEYDPTWESTLDTIYSDSSKYYIGLKEKEIIYKTKLTSVKRISVSEKYKGLRWLNDSFFMAYYNEENSLDHTSMALFRVTLNAGVEFIESYKGILGNEFLYLSERVGEGRSNFVSFYFYNEDLKTYETKSILLIDDVFLITSDDNAYRYEYAINNKYLFKKLDDQNTINSFIMTDLNSNISCETNFADGKLKFISQEVLEVNTQDYSKTTYYKINDLCDLTEIYSVNTSPWVEVIGDTLIIRSTDGTSTLRLIREGKLFVVKEPEQGFHANIKSETEITWNKVNSDFTEILKSFTMNFKTGAKVTNDPRYIPYRCDGSCIDKSNSVEGKVYFTVEGSQTKIYTIITKDKNIISSQLEIQQRSGSTIGEFDDSSKVELKTGSLMKVFKNSYIYIK